VRVLVGFVLGKKSLEREEREKAKSKTEEGIEKG
jgi:hypothetical protein